MSFLTEMLPETSEVVWKIKNSLFKDGFLDFKTQESIGSTF
ncbi:hypothetical protein RG963_08750 [Methanosarcina sp. Z-7115]|uniref:Uncharacterized protein n=1 Tax=Methanosarcina baikalica TaxID=3073890 RepID=A0ABU2D1K7_9EURY|nr:hypothetical protein [Methanosarcina sp. Z-7115]MDR7665857.1 hypothetical protein [Methanosarcina sp. Z-7115]